MHNAYLHISWSEKNYLDRFLSNCLSHSAQPSFSDQKREKWFLIRKICVDQKIWSVSSPEFVLGGVGPPVAVLELKRWEGVGSQQIPIHLKSNQFKSNPTLIQSNQFQSNCQTWLFPIEFGCFPDLKRIWTDSCQCGQLRPFFGWIGFWLACYKYWFWIERESTVVVHHPATSHHSRTQPVSKNSLPPRCCCCCSLRLHSTGFWCPSIHPSAYRSNSTAFALELFWRYSSI